METRSLFEIEIGITGLNSIIYYGLLDPTICSLIVMGVLKCDRIVGRIGDVKKALRDIDCCFIVRKKNKIHKLLRAKGQIKEWGKVSVNNKHVKLQCVKYW